MSKAKGAQALWAVYARTGPIGSDVRNVIANNITDALQKATKMFHHDYTLNGSDVFEDSDISKVECLGWED